MAREYKRALALDEGTYLELCEKGFRSFFFFFVSRNMCRDINTPDGLYKIFLWDWETPNYDTWKDLKRFLKECRYALIEIAEDGEITTDIKDENEYGCDEVFYEILGYKAEIVLWNDPSQVLV